MRFYIFLLILIFSKYAQAQDSIHQFWSYEGKTAAQYWGDLDKSFLLCKEGKHQSPINLENKLLNKNNPHINFRYNEFNVEKKPYTIEVSEKSTKYIEIEDKIYSLMQFHFHIPSEHSINNTKYDMELHFVHKGNDNTIAVVGVFIKEGKSNKFISRIINKAISRINKDNYLDDDSLDEILPDSREYYHYIGSLTTPPCSENVNWYVLKTPIEASKEEIQEFHKIIKLNARPIQKTTN